MALGVTTQRTLPVRQVRQGLARAVKTAGPDGDLDTDLQDALGVGSEAVFGQQVQQAGRKAFYVFPDATLQRIAAARPQTVEDLQAVKGVGPKKLELYGPAVLDITRQGAEGPQVKEQEERIKRRDPRLK